MKTIGLIFMLALGVLATALLAQEAPRSEEPARAPRHWQGSAVMDGITIVGPGGRQHGDDIDTALRAWKEAESESDREAARAKLREVLVQEYDRAIGEYEKYLDELSKRLEELRGQVDERRDAKDKVVELRLEMLLQEAEGLGWPGDRRTLRFAMPGFNPFDASVAPIPGVPSAPAAEPSRTPRAPLIPGGGGPAAPRIPGGGGGVR